MAKFRNASSETVLDAHTMKVAEPDQVIDVPDDWAEAYENHPVWQAVPDLAAATRPKPVVAPTPENDTTEEVTQ